MTYVVYYGPGPHDIRIDHCEGNCRDYECLTGGCHGGFSVEEAKAIIADYYRMKADWYRHSTNEEFLRDQGLL
jgi:hypothetical protein